MNTQAGRYHVVSDGKGRIVALVPVAAARLAGGVELGWRPVAGRGQRVAEIELAREHAALAPHELIAGFSVKIDRKTGRAHLARRGKK